MLIAVIDNSKALLDSGKKLKYAEFVFNDTCFIIAYNFEFDYSYQICGNFEFYQW